MTPRVTHPAQGDPRRRSPRLDFAAVIQANIARRPEGPRVFADWAHI